ncbi:MAG: trypsin-like peptidase domain-containing protein [Devosia sp.]
MKRRPLYSRSGRPRQAGAAALTPVTFRRYADAPQAPAGPTLRQRVRAFSTKLYARHPGPIVVAASLVLTLLSLGAYDIARPPAVPLTQDRFNEALDLALEDRPRAPATGALAYAAIIPSVVRVVGSATLAESLGQAPETPAEADASRQPFHEQYSSVGTGVVIDEQGTILTNFHVARSAPFLRVTFADGTETAAQLVGAAPENDLAIIKAPMIPENVRPAVITSSETLTPGDEVFAVGFPFGIGPSASAGVVSGLKREFASEGDESVTLKDLIQFDAAANPGNSGGPLVNRDGEVVGLVTAILNPSGSRVWAGIGFAVPIETAALEAGENPL